MPWNRTTRKDYKRDGRRYESDVTDKEWAIVESMPKQGPLGRPRETDLREVFNDPVCAGRAVSGGRCRVIFRPIRRLSTTFTGGAVFSTA